jgi:hypothetical protein
MTYLTQQVAVTGYCTSALNSKSIRISIFSVFQMTLLKVGVDPNTPARQVALRHFRPKMNLMDGACLAALSWT